LDDAAAGYLAAKIDSRADALEFSRLLKDRIGGRPDRWLQSSLAQLEQRFGPLDQH
jgi:hypothetical protein